MHKTITEWPDVIATLDEPGIDAVTYLGDAQALHGGGINADVIVTDPPYMLTSGGYSESASTFGGWLGSPEYDNSGGVVACDITWPEIMALCYDALAENGDAYIMANNRNVQAALNAAEAAGFKFHNILVWDKVTAIPNRWYMKNCEFTLYLYKGKASTINDPSSAQLIKCPQQNTTKHPTEKPVALMQHYIENSTKPGDLVYDPFTGSGTTGVAALASGRRFIGCELDEEYHAITAQRLKVAASQRSLF